ncbi:MULTISPECIES: condensation domain-containing protein [unclassified Mycobacterium]|uniref:condensation domain-containing protein n=1 Tax=unclassified Mycobacterium TaxID=2642494 RepID=UPI00068D1C11|nr:MULTISPECIES: condensation domain-containing protein [unclassified Mycobacterium]SEB19971.1 Condensation domain-containing protein [Mycobacterium sp. 283mftsu]
MVAIRTIHDWMGSSGVLTSWNPSSASLAKLRNAPVSSVPVSYQQSQHIRAFRSHERNGTDMARLNIAAWDMPGKCDVRAMTHVINAYVRRHDTFHSWFELLDDDSVVRRTAKSPRDIKLVATEHGEMNAQQWRDHVLATPDPLQWDCFHFGIIQRDDHFTFYFSIDHVHTDALLMGLVLVEIHLMYAALVSGAPPIPLADAGSYDDYCVKQAEFTSALTLESPEVKDWIKFAEANDGTLPCFPLPLGDPSVPCGGEMLTVRLMDKHQSERFESACLSAGARVIGGVIACAALAEHELTGRPIYNVITPTTTRRTPAEFMTTGWFTGVVPISVPVVPESFGDTARAMQKAFDAGMELAHVPFERVLELAEGKVASIRKADPGVPMVSYLDTNLPPLSPAIMNEWERLNGRVYSDARSAYQIGIWVNRSEKETSVTIAYPDNPIARESVDKYLHAMRAVYLRVADGGGSGSGRSDALRHNGCRSELIRAVKG